MEKLGIEPRTSRIQGEALQSERSTTELHPQVILIKKKFKFKRNLTKNFKEIYYGKRMINKR